MAKLIIDEKKMMEESVFKFEEKLNSPMGRYLDTTPTFVTYYHINNEKTTTDDGYLDVNSIIGKFSPLRYNRIGDFPIYGMEQVVLQIQDSDQGLDSSYEGEATILPNTITPLPNDFFVIPYLHDAYLFRVTETTYDSVVADNFYKINFKLEYIDQEKINQIEEQSVEKYSCVLQNIGSENNCIIRTDDAEIIEKIDAMYDDIASTYKTIFYNDRHNCFLGEKDSATRIYDPLQTEFINKHSLFARKDSLDTLILTEQYNDPRRKLKYEKSIYRVIERRDSKLLSTFPYVLMPGTSSHDSSFYRWCEKGIWMVDIPSVLPDNPETFLSEEFITSVTMNIPTDTKHSELIKKFMRREPMEIRDIPLDLNEELIRLDANLEVFFFTPIIMYIIKTVVAEYTKVMKEE